MSIRVVGFLGCIGSNLFILSHKLGDVVRKPSSSAGRTIVFFHASRSSITDCRSGPLPCGCHVRLPMPGRIYAISLTSQFHRIATTLVVGQPQRTRTAQPRSRERLASYLGIARAGQRLLSSRIFNETPRQTPGPVGDTSGRPERHIILLWNTLVK